jgi:signal transduction histidine kinase
MLGRMTEPVDTAPVRGALRAGHLLATLVLAGSLLLVLVAWHQAREQELTAAKEAFATSTMQAVELIEQRLVNYELTTRGGVALFGTVARPTPVQWHAYFAGLKLSERFPAIVGLGFAPYVTSSGLEALQLEVRATTGALYGIRPRGVRDHYAPVFYLEPKTAENMAALGYDMYVEPGRRAAMDAARDSGRLQLSGRVALVQERGDEPALLLLAPVYRAGDDASSVAARRVSMQGWVYVSFRVRNFVDAALRPLRRPPALRIVDVTGGASDVLYADRAFAAASAPTYSRSVVRELYGRQWRFDFATNADAAAPRLRDLRHLLAIGVLSSFLLFALTWVLARTEARAQRIAERMTEAHRRSEAEVRALNRSLEARVATRTRELREANRELEAFAYTVSHDLRAPLRAIDGFSAALLEQQGERLDSGGRAYLERVRNAAARMGQLIDSMLKLARYGRAELRREPLNLGRIAFEIEGELRAAEPDRAVEVAIEPELFATGDPGLVRSLLQNLVGNAWKFTRGREPARIELGRDPETGEFFVRDNGIGFEPEYAGKLFRAFQRLHDDAYAGDGIGLASVKRIVERHGGTVRAEGRPGEGAMFRFTLPEPADGD